MQLKIESNNLRERTYMSTSKSRIRIRTMNHVTLRQTIDDTPSHVAIKKKACPRDHDNTLNNYPSQIHRQIHCKM